MPKPNLGTPRAAISPMQAKFVGEYVVDMNGPKAAVRAGYSKKSAPGKAAGLLNDPQVRQLIDIELAKRYERREGDVDFILDTLRETIDRCRQVEPVLDRSGEPVLVKTADGMLRAAFKFNPTGVLEGLKLLGKHLGMFEESRSTNIAVTVNIRRFGDGAQTTDKELKDITPKAVPIEQTDVKEIASAHG